MPKFSDQRILPYSQDQMFHLVADVARYHEFLPWCLATRVYNQKIGRFDADMVIGFKMFREKISSRVTVNATEKVYVDYLSGPLKRLYNHWHFSENDNGECVIDFEVDFEFKSRMLENLIGDVFTKATHKMIQAFEDRAKDLYG